MQACFSAVFLVLPLVVGSLPATAAPLGTGSISGRVVDGEGNPLTGICVGVENGPGAQSDSAGAFAVTGLDSGQYKLSFVDCNPTPQFVEQWYLGRADSGTADLLSVTDGFDVPLADITMQRGVSVTGTVTDAKGAPIPDMTVTVSPAPGTPSTSVQTDGAGAYATIPLAAGEYKVQFADRSSTPVYATEYWSDTPSWNTADSLKLNPVDGPVQAGIDAQLAVGATVVGTVTGPSGDLRAGICVDANVLNNGGWDWIGGAVTDAKGEYAMASLPPVDVRILFRDCSSGPLLNQWYDGQQNAESSTPVVLGPGEIRPGVNAQLAQGITVSGTVTDADGNPLAGIGVNVNPTENGTNASAQTDSSGNYTTNALAPGDYRVQFDDWSPDPQWASQYWDGALSWNAATTLTLSGDDAPDRGGVNAMLTGAARVSGTVTAPDGEPAGGVCVNAVIETKDGPDSIGSTSTGKDGTYVMDRLPAATAKIIFRSCNDDGAYVEQWWDNAPTYDSATPLVLEPGAGHTGIDARLEAAGVITGYVTDLEGNALEGICAQATTNTFVGGVARSDGKGRYSINLARAGSYRIQFVDCTGSAKYAGEWWDDQPSSATANVITVAPGETVGKVDAALAPGAAGSISGTVRNLNGVAMTSVCVIAYVPDSFALIVPIAADGTYTIPDVPSATYALAFLSCDDGELAATVADPESAAITYRAVWWKGVAIELAAEMAPDPIAQGATLVTIKPGQHLAGYDWCFGCTAISIMRITPGDGSLTVAFTTPLMVAADQAGLVSAAGRIDPTAAADPLVYTVTCTSDTGVAGSASGPGSPITVTGLTPGASYTCQVTASDGAVTVASSEGEAIVLPASMNGSGGGALPVSFPTAPAAPAGGEMARTGVDSAASARLGASLLGVGLLLVALTRRRRCASARS